MVSEIGDANQTPLSSKKCGKISNVGIKNKICRDIDKKIETLGFPIA